MKINVKALIVLLLCFSLYAVRVHAMYGSVSSEKEDTSGEDEESIENDGCYAETGCLHSAAHEGNLEKVKKFLRSGYETVHSCDSRGWTPLHYAAFSGESEVVKLLLENKADINLGSPCGHRVIHIAAREGSNEALEILLKCVAVDPTEPTSRGNSPLHLAARFGRINVVNTLLKYFNEEDINNEEEMNTKNRRGRTALNCAVLKGQEHVVGRLLSEGAVTNPPEGHRCDERCESKTPQNLRINRALFRASGVGSRYAPGHKAFAKDKFTSLALCSLQHLCCWNIRMRRLDNIEEELTPTALKLYRTGRWLLRDDLSDVAGEDFSGGAGAARAGAGEADSDREFECEYDETVELVEPASHGDDYDLSNYVDGVDQRGNWSDEEEGW